MTQIELSKRVGVKQPTLSAIESGGTERPQLAILRALAYELGDDFGDADLRRYLKQRKENPSKDILRQVVAFVGHNDLVLKLFVVRLSRESEAFRELLDQKKLEEITVEAGRELRMVESIMTGSVDSEVAAWFLDGLDEEELGDEVGPMQPALPPMITRSMGRVDGGEEKHATRRRKKAS